MFESIHFGYPFLRSRDSPKIRSIGHSSTSQGNWLHFTKLYLSVQNTSTFYRHFILKRTAGEAQFIDVGVT